MTDGDNKFIENELGDAWDTFHNWLYCICVVTFDLELGQALEASTFTFKTSTKLLPVIFFQSVFPRHVTLTKQEISNVCYLAFPDSNSGCMGDTNFIIRLQNNQGTKNLKNEHNYYNTKCPTAMQVDGSFYWGYVYFRQVKDISLPRGYFQKVLKLVKYVWTVFPGV